MRRGAEPPLPGESIDTSEVVKHLTIEPWVDAVVEAHGFGPRSLYVEACYLPVLGPTATWLYRRLGTWIELQPEAIELDLIDLGVSLGVGEGLGRHAPLTRAFARLARFGVARWQGERLGVRRAMAPLPERRAVQLSQSAYQLHRQLTGSMNTMPTWRQR